MADVERLYILIGVQQTARLNRIVAAALQLGYNLPLAGDKTLAERDVPLGFSQVFLKPDPVHGTG